MDFGLSASLPILAKGSVPRLPSRIASPIVQVPLPSACKSFCPRWLPRLFCCAMVTSENGPFGSLPSSYQPTKSTFAFKTFALKCAAPLTKFFSVVIAKMTRTKRRRHNSASSSDDESAVHSDGGWERAPYMPHQRERELTAQLTELQAEFDSHVQAAESSHAVLERKHEVWKLNQREYWPFDQIFLSPVFMYRKSFVLPCFQPVSHVKHRIRLADLGILGMECVPTPSWPFPAR